ncbi:MAG: hypothetical protein H6Q01_742 [Acidobacteria bacterium]|nr:hypothetical protein [Acidobacteriota bacterium]
MMRRTAILLALLAATVACGKPKAAGPMTLVLVSIDTLRADRVGAYGRSDAGTPAIDRLAGQGVRFDRAQATAPVTLPSHASMLTGRSLPAHGVYDNGTYALPDSVPTLAEALAKRGFKTAAFVSSPVLARRFGLARGFSEYDDRIAKTRSPLHWEQRSGADTVIQSLAWLALQGDAPAFLWVHMFEPHRPYSAPEPFASRFPDHPYQAEVAAADAAVGQLLDGLRALGREGNLLVAVVADHGEGLGDHGEPTHGVFLYETTMRVPFVLWGPALGVAKGLVVGAPVSVADLAPTLLEFAEAPPFPAIDGASLAGIARGTVAAPEQRGVFAEAHAPSIAYGWSGLRALVRGQEKLIAGPRARLFDLANDPGETRDLAAERPDAVRATSEALTDALRRALAIAPEPGEASGSVSAADHDALRGLGYAATGATSSSRTLVDPSRTDPHDRVDFIERFDRALRLVQKGDPKQAAAILGELAALEPANKAAQFEYGQALIQAGDLDRARAVYEQLVVTHPESALAWFRLGQLRDQAGDAPGAETAWRHGADADPRNGDVLKALASLLAGQRRYEEAIAAAEAALALEPGNRGIQRDIATWSAASAGGR